jgi:hypothetical protein
MQFILKTNQKLNTKNTNSTHYKQMNLPTLSQGKKPFWSGGTLNELVA